MFFACVRSLKLILAHTNIVYNSEMEKNHVSSQDVHRSTTIPDERGKHMPALGVFAEAIGYLKRHVMKSCDERGFGLSEREIKWVLTVPAIWGDAAKQFMRTAAEQVPEINNTY